MEEGKRMFQIFAARLFEQRVLQAYREKQAKVKEEQLLRELEEEEDQKQAKEQKKAMEAQKKKDKKKLVSLPLMIEYSLTKCQAPEAESRRGKGGTRCRFGRTATCPEGKARRA